MIENAHMNQLMMKLSLPSQVLSPSTLNYVNMKAFQIMQLVSMKVVMPQLKLNCVMKWHLLVHSTAQSTTLSLCKCIS